MDVIDSLPSGDDLIPIFNEQTLAINDECSNDMSVVYCVIPGDESKTNTNNDFNDKKSIDGKYPIPRRYKTVSYGPINVRVSLHDTLTLETGRRSKFTPLEGDEATKRELRRQKNRETARKLKEKRTNIEHELINEINGLESHENDLIEEIRNLKSYKQFLEKRYQEKILSTKSTTRTTPFEVKCHEYKQTKIEPYPPSS